MCVWNETKCKTFRLYAINPETRLVEWVLFLLTHDFCSYMLCIFESMWIPLFESFNSELLGKKWKPQSLKLNLDQLRTPTPIAIEIWVDFKGKSHHFESFKVICIGFPLNDVPDAIFETVSATLVAKRVKTLLFSHRQMLSRIQINAPHRPEDGAQFLFCIEPEII